MTQNFGTWIREVDTLCIGKFGLGVNDLPDMAYRDWYDDGITVEEAMELVEDELSYEGWVSQ